MADPIARWVAGRIQNAIPADRHLPAVEWARKNVFLPGSVLVDRYNPDATPWTRAIVQTLDDISVRVCTVMAPVQSGKSVIGEIAADLWLSTWTGGDVQWNWESNDKARKRYEKRIEKIIRACPPLSARWPADPNKAKIGQVIFPHANLVVQGQEVRSNLDSDSIRGQINEELHNWGVGRLQKATGRLTAVWNAKQLNLSNAGEKGDQLDVAYRKGTQEVWGFVCPHCGKWQAWRTERRRDASREWIRGGMIYNAEGARRGKFEYDYGELEKTLYYECEHCGGRIYEGERRSLKSHYIAQNPNPLKGHRSFRWDAVAIHYIPWIQLIQEKHQALKALAHGDNGPWRVYITERECRPWSPDEEPNTHKVTLSTGVKKANPEPGEYDTTIATVDCQRGTTGDVPHFWVVIRGYKEGKTGFIRAPLVWEGRINSKKEVDDLVSKHGIQPAVVFVDSGDQTESVYAWCAALGYTAIKGMGGDGFVTETEDAAGDKERVRKIWRCDPDRPVAVPTASGTVLIPLILYAKDGIRNRLQSNRESPMWQWEIPEDVSDDFVAHYAAEEMTMDADGRRKFKQTKRRNDLYVCDCYQALGYDIWRTFNRGEA